MYRSQYEIKIDGKRVYLVHREFPTDFRYDKKRLADDSYTEPSPPSTKHGNRGHYDIGVLNPRFVVDNSDINIIRNKGIRYIEKRVNREAKILLFAVEFKYITSNGKSWIQQVLEDTKKLQFGREQGVLSAFNLVFCNIPYWYESELIERVKSSSTNVNVILIRSTDGRGGKPKPLTNTPSFFSRLGVEAQRA